MAQALQVEQGSSADPGFFLSVRGGGGGGGGGSRPDGQKTVWTMCFFKSSTYFTVYRVDPMVLLQRGGGGPTSSRGWGCPKKPI